MLTTLVVSQYVSPDMGGAERYIHEVTSRLESRGVKFYFLSDRGVDEQKLSSPIRFFSGGFHPSWTRQTDEVLIKTKPDVIFAHFTVPGITDLAVRRAARLKIPVCLAYHSDVTGPQWYRKVLGFCYHKSAGRGTLDLADRIIVCSREYQQASPWLSSIKKTFHFIGCGVDPAMAGGRREPSYPYLLFAGKPDVKSKGFDVLYRAWLELRKSFSGLELLVAGDSVMTNKYPYVRFLGRIDSRQKLADLYAGAELTVLPSISKAESFGMVLAESLVAGTPVVGSDIGGIPAVVQEGINGYTARPGDESDLFRAVSMALRNKKELRQNIKNCREEYLKRFDWDRIAAQVGSVLAECAGKSMNQAANPG